MVSFVKKRCWNKKSRYSKEWNQNIFLYFKCSKMTSVVWRCGACKNGQTECFDCGGTGKCVRFVELKSSFHTRINASYDTTWRIPTHLLDESLSNNIFYEQKDQEVCLLFLFKYNFSLFYFYLFLFFFFFLLFKLNAISENSTLASLSEISHKLLSQHSTHKDNTRILAQVRLLLDIFNSDRFIWMFFFIQATLRKSYTGDCMQVYHRRQTQANTRLRVSARRIRSRTTFR